MNRYPYPVLAEDNSSYVEGTIFKLTYVKSLSIHNEITFEFNINMNSKYLKELINNGYAKVILKVQTSIYAESIDINDIDGNVKIKMLLDNIASNDTLKFICYIVANESIYIEKNEELLDIYDQDYKVKLKKFDVIGISNMESLSYSTSSNDFIKFSVSDEQNGKGYSIEYATNFINVRIGPDLNAAYGMVKNGKRDACTIFDSHLVFEVFVYVLTDLVQRFEELNEEQWYILFNQIFLQTSEYDSFETFIKSAKDGELIDLSIIIEVAHKMINNQIENSLISISKLGEA